MATLKAFEDIESWQKARALTKRVYALSNNGGFSRDFGLRDQIRRAAVSIMSNIAEGFGRKSNVEFANFLNYSHGSASEVQSLLYVAYDQQYIGQAEFDSVYDECEQISKMVLSLANYLRKNNKAR